MPHLMDFKGENKSGDRNLNLLYKVTDSNVYIMDNHLAGSWSWAKEIDITKNYTLVHIDQHFDLNKSHEFTEFESMKQILLERDIQNLHSFRHKTIGAGRIPSVNWDNYMHFFEKCFPSLVVKNIFICNEDINNNSYNYFSQKGDVINSDILDLKEVNIQTEIIFNLDLDYFFTIQEEESNPIHRVNDFELKVNILKEWYSNNKENIKVFTIALSPEFCSNDGTWIQSKKVLKEILEAFKIEFSFEDIFGI